MFGLKVVITLSAKMKCFLLFLPFASTHVRQINVSNVYRRERNSLFLADVAITKTTTVSITFTFLLIIKLITLNKCLSLQYFVSNCKNKQMFSTEKFWCLFYLSLPNQISKALLTCIFVVF